MCYNTQQLYPHFYSTFHDLVDLPLDLHIIPTVVAPYIHVIWLINASPSRKTPELPWRQADTFPINNSLVLLSGSYTMFHSLSATLKHECYLTLQIYKTPRSSNKVYVGYFNNLSNYYRDTNNINVEGLKSHILSTAPAKSGKKNWFKKSLKTL